MPGFVLISLAQVPGSFGGRTMLLRASAELKAPGSLVADQSGDELAQADGGA